ncbi:MAG: fasciclin domain-containing protein, partial [Novosphingobium sp.]
MAPEATATAAAGNSMVGGAEMFADKPIATNASAAPNLTTLVAAVKQAGLVDTLAGPGPFTVFAPTNDAFAKVDKATLDG